MVVNHWHYAELADAAAFVGRSSKVKRFGLMGFDIASCVPKIYEL